MNNAITRRTVADRAGNRIDPPPMATYCEPSQRARISARAEAMALLRVLDSEPRPARREPEPVIQPEPVLNTEFIAGLIAGLAFSGLVAAALILGDRL